MAKSSITPLLAQLDRKGRYLFANPEYQLLMAPPGKSLEGLNFRAVLNKPHSKQFTNCFDCALRGKAVTEILKIAAGTKSRLIQFTWTASYYHGKITAVSIFAIDVEAPEKLAQSLRQSEHRYRSLLETARESIHVIDLATGEYVDMNEAGLKMLNITRDEFRTMDFLSISAPVQDDGLPPDESFQRRLPELLENGYYEGIWQIVHPKTKELRIHEFHATLINDGTQIRVLELDVTDRIKAERELKDSAQYFLTLVETAHEFISIIDVKQGVYEWANTAATEFLSGKCGVSRQGIIGSSPLETMPELQPNGRRSDEMLAEVFTQAVNGIPQSLEWYHQQQDSEELLPMSVHVNHFPFQEKNLVRVFALEIYEQKKQEALLRQSEERYRSLVENSPEPIAVIDIYTGRFVAFNKATERVFELSRSELLKKTVMDISDPIQTSGKSRQDTFIINRRRLLEENVVRFPQWRVVQQHSRRTIILDSIASLLPGGETIRIATQDVTLRHEMELAAIQRESRYRMMTENTFEAITILDPKTMKFVDGNQLNCELFGVTYEELLNYGPPEVSADIQPDGRPTAEVAEQYINEVMQQGYSVFEWMHRNQKTGEDILCEVRLQRIPDSEPQLLRVSVVDIREQKKARQELQRKEENLRATLDSIGDAVVTTDTQGLIVKINRVAENLTGWRAEKTLGLPLQDVFYLTQENTQIPVEDPVKQVLRSGKLISISNDSILHGANNTEYRIASSGAPIHSETGEVNGVVLVIRDITDEYITQEKLRQTEKMQAVGQLAGGIAHDFNNMLSIISGAAEVIEFSSGKELTARSKTMLETIVRTTTRAAELTTKLTAFGRAGGLTKAPFPIHESLISTVNILKRTLDKKIETRTTLNAKQQIVNGNQAVFESALLNIAINASHAMQQNGGIFTISTRNINVSKQASNASTFDITPGEYIEIKMHDTGIGIPSENIKRIFEPFFTTKKEVSGSGLGLSAVYGTVRDHHGLIDVDSIEGVETTFRILLPCCYEQIKNAKKPDEPLEPQQQTILLVDDEADVRLTVEMMLNELGMEVLLAKGGREALKLFKQHRASIDLIIMDMNMPEMSGRETIQEIRKLDSECPIILSSGFSDPEQMGGMEGLNISGVLSKPYLLREMEQTLNSVIKKESAYN